MTEERFVRLRPLHVQWLTDYTPHPEGWTELEIMEKKNTIIEIIEELDRLEIPKTVRYFGGMHGRTIIVYELPVHGIQSTTETVQFLIYSPVHCKRFRSKKRRGICQYDVRDNVNRTVRRSEMTHLRKNIDNEYINSTL